MTTTYDVRIYKTEIYKGTNGSSYYVRWKAGRVWRKVFKTAALADSFRSELHTAARRGESFDTTTGEPVSWGRKGASEVTWYDLACRFVDMKWKSVSPRYRQDIARALTAATPAMYSTNRGKPDAALLRKTMTHWAFNSKQREEASAAEVVAALGWLASNTKPVASLATSAELVRQLLDAATSTLEGVRAAPDTVRKHKMLVTAVLDYAIELKILTANPVKSIKWSVPRNTLELDERTVVNHNQAKRLLDALTIRKETGPRLVAFFALIYYAALRPEEALSLRASNITLPPLVENPDTGLLDHNPLAWGEMRLYKASSHVGSAWTDSGASREERALKHRAEGQGRTVPIVPQLVKILRDHLADYPEGPGGLLFYGPRGGQALPLSTYRRAWSKARQHALTPDECTSPLARRPYDLRHACVSTWLNAGVPSTQVAAWAGHSVDVLHRIYAKCVEGQDETARRRIVEALDD